MQEIIVFLHHKPGPYRVHELDDAGEEEHHSGNETAEALKAQKKVSHVLYLFIAESTADLIFAKIASGGSISPFSSEQSMRMNLGSRSHCFL